MKPLPGFQPVDEDDVHGRLHQLLWPTPASSPPAASAAGEPAALAEHVDVWMGNEGNDEGRADVMHEDKSEPPSIRFIDLPSYASTSSSATRRNSFNPSTIHWYLQLWVDPCDTLVWTSSPRGERRRHFTKQFLARVWCMSPWSSTEIAAVTKLQEKDPVEIQARFELSGPVARSLFADPERANLGEIDKVIRTALTKGLFEFATSEGPDEESSHQIYLVRPHEERDADGVIRLIRRERTFDFLSSKIGPRVVSMMDNTLTAMRTRLVCAFHNPHTRSAAGKLVEAILRRAFSDGPVAPFGFGSPFSELTLIGKATDFFFGARMSPLTPPLYLRPQDQNFAAVDAIIVYNAVLWLVQTSLASWHTTVFKTLIAILVRLESNGIDLQGVRIVYCLIGTDDKRVGSLVHSSTNKLVALQKADPVLRAIELRQTQSVTNRFLQLGVLGVEGYTFITETQLARMP
ncbi:hypothetical protein C8J57DRAFT_1566553 [Mycena rebaudengoi]|nr:hypothetical protein C8J57DRAFT_1566553 [Mycena rebaudengoi]